MLATAHRLRRRSEFAAAIRTGHRARRPSLVVHLMTGAGDAPPRVGFVVSRAVGGAVERNRVRRRLRHLVCGHLDALPPGALLVVRALPAAATAPYRRLGDDLTAAIGAASRAGVTR
jgi:ribonuclease P protein component